MKKYLGTSAVYFTAISTILGAVMFLRFGYAVSNVGFVGTLGIILIGHIITIATSLSIAEIATNKKVEGGGEYFIISRSFGLKIGASIGTSLYLSQAISVAFYIVAMMEAFDPLIAWVGDISGWYLIDKRFISIPVMGFLAWLMLTKGAKIGMITLYVVNILLFVSLALFFFGNTGYAESFELSRLFDKVKNGDDFFIVFAIVFPAFTGMTAGVGLSGDLKNPSKSIPIGTLLATLSGMIIYVFIALKLTMSASPEALNADQLIMSKIAIWGPIIPIGLAAATFSSALGSLMVAPRTLQAIASDNILPSGRINRFLSKTNERIGEPVNATIVTSIFATVFLLIGELNFVAKIISMFFMVTYGSICLISFLEHFSADPSYRPTFKSKWYISLTGALFCIYLMFQMNFSYAMLAIFIMALLYVWINHAKKEEKSLASIFQGAIFQISRKLQVFLQQSNDSKSEPDTWRPSMVCISSESFSRYDAFELIKWISFKYGFGTYLHFKRDYLNKETSTQAKKELQKLLEINQDSKSNVYIDTIINPSYTAAISQALQFPGISGKENNILLFEFDKENPVGLEAILENLRLAKALDYDVCILSSSDRGFGYKREIHIWITPNDFKNANLMILLGYIILGHPEWKKSQIKIFALFDENEMDVLQKELFTLIHTGRLPISTSNVVIIPYQQYSDVKNRIKENSFAADLTLLGFDYNISKEQADSFFTGFDNVGNILFVNSSDRKQIV